MDRLSADVFNDTPAPVGAITRSGGGDGNRKQSGCDEVVVMRMPSREGDEGRGISGRVRETSPTLAVARAVRLATTNSREEEEKEEEAVEWVI